MTDAQVNGRKPASEMTKREVIAKDAMKGLLAGVLSDGSQINMETGPRETSIAAQVFADALLERLEATKCETKI